MPAGRNAECSLVLTSVSTPSPSHLSKLSPNPPEQFLLRDRILSGPQVPSHVDHGPHGVNWAAKQYRQLDISTIFQNFLRLLSAQLRKFFRT